MPFFSTSAGESFSQQYNKSLSETAEGTGHTQMEGRLGSTLPEMIGTIINVILTTLGVVFLALIIYGGYIWFAARGNDSEVKKAQMILRNSIIGIIIVLAAYAITNFVGSALLNSRTK